MIIRWSDELLKHASDKFEAVVVAALECRIINNYYRNINRINRETNGNEDAPVIKPPDTIPNIALQKLKNGEIEYIYYDEENSDDYKMIFSSEEDDSTAKRIKEEILTTPKKISFSTQQAEEEKEEDIFGRDSYDLHDEHIEQIKEIDEHLTSSSEDIDNIESNEDDYFTGMLPGNIGFNIDNDDEE